MHLMLFGHSINGEKGGSQFLLLPFLLLIVSHYHAAMGVLYYLNLAELVVQNWASFKWDKLHEAMPFLAPNLLLANFQLICLDYIRKDAKEVTQEFEIPKIVQVTYYAMVVANAVKLAFSQRSWAQHVKGCFGEPLVVFV